MRTTYEMKIDLWRLYVMDRRVKDTQWSSSVCSYINILTHAQLVSQLICVQLVLLDWGSDQQNLYL